MKTALDQKPAPNIGVQNSRAWVASIFAVAFALRLAILAFTFPGNEKVYYYDDAKIALNLIAGNGYSISYDYRNWLFYESVLKTEKLRNPVTEGTRITAVKQPAYPLVLTGLFYCFGPKNFLVVFLFQALMSSLTAVIVFLALRQRTPFEALAASFGLAIYPPMAFHCVTSPESTTLLMLILAAIWLCLVNMQLRASWRLWLFLGALSGLAVLTEPVTVPFIAFGLCYAAYLERASLQKCCARLAVSAIVMILIVSPWLLRNYLVFERFPVFKSGLGLVFNWGLHFSGKGSWISDETMLQLEEKGRSLSELQEDEGIRRELRSLFPNHWREYVFTNIPMNLAHFWWDVRRYWDNYSIGYLFGRRIPYLVLLAIALPSLLRFLADLARRTRATLQDSEVKIAALALIGSYSLLYGLFGAFHSRYRLPVEMALVVFASKTISPLVARPAEAALRFLGRLWPKSQPAVSEV